MQQPEMAQDEAEITAFVDLLMREGVRSYLEIGSKFGGSLWRVGKALPKGSRLVSVDLREGTRRWASSSQSLTRVHAELRRLGHETHALWTDSQTAETVEEARALGPFDAVFIDADHRLPGVTKDWQNYGPMGRIVAFHDLAWKRGPDWKGVPINVPEFWASIKDAYRHEEIVLCPTNANNGIGVLWRS